MKIRKLPLETGLWTIYKDPVAGHMYVIGADSAAGIPGRNGSAAHVGDINTREIVAVLNANIGPDRLAQEIILAGYWYNTALLAPEHMFHGVHVIYKLVQDTPTPYPNVFRHEGELTSDLGHPAHTYGWKQNESNRNLMLSILQSDLSKAGAPTPEGRKGELLVPDIPTLGQLKTFKRNAKGKAEAASGQCDDLVISLGITNAVMHMMERSIPAPVEVKPKTLFDQMMGQKGSAQQEGGFFETLEVY